MQEKNALNIIPVCIPFMQGSEATPLIISRFVNIFHQETLTVKILKKNSSENYFFFKIPPIGKMHEKPKSYFHFKQIYCHFL